MAHTATNDSSITGPAPQVRPGVTHREADQYVHAELPPEHPERTRKGDLGTIGLPTPRPLTGPGPFSGLKKER